MSHLQRILERCKKDPESYKDDFLFQLKHFDSHLQIIKLKPNEDSKEFSTFVHFISSVSIKIYH